MLMVGPRTRYDLPLDELDEEAYAGEVNADAKKKEKEHVETPAGEREGMTEVRKKEVAAVRAEQEKEIAEKAKAVEVARAKAMGEYPTKRPDPTKFEVDLSASGEDLLIHFKDAEGKKIVRQEAEKLPTGVQVFDVPAGLHDYLPALKKLHVRYETDPKETKMRITEVDGEQVLFLPPNPSEEQKRALIPMIIEKVVANGLVKDNEAVKKAEEDLDTAVKKLQNEHTTEHRIHKLEAAEKKVVEAKKARTKKLEAKIEAVLDRVMAEQHLDLAAAVGGKEAMIAKAEKKLENAAKRDLWNNKGLVFGEHFLHEHHEESGFIKKYTVDAVNKHFVEPMLTDQKMIQGKFEKIREEVDRLPKKGLYNRWRKSDAMKGMRYVAKTVREGWQGPKHFMMKPAVGVMALGVGVGSVLWGITELPGMKGAKEEIGKFFKWVGGLVGLEAGKGGHGGGHGGGHH